MLSWLWSQVFFSSDLLTVLVTCSIYFVDVAGLWDINIDKSKAILSCFYVKQCQVVCSPLSLSLIIVNNTVQIEFELIISDHRDGNILIIWDGDLKECKETSSSGEGSSQCYVKWCTPIQV